MNVNHINNKIQTLISENKINPYSRKNNKIGLDALFPKIIGKCSCGCNNDLPPRKRRWFDSSHAYNAHMIISVIKGNSAAIRELLYKRDKGVCKACNTKTNDWDADHIIPVCLGGGGRYLDNFQTLCKSCHKEKTKEDLEHLRNSK